MAGALDFDVHAGDVAPHPARQAQAVGERVDERAEAHPLDDAFDVHVYPFERGHRASVRLSGVACMRIGSCRRAAWRDVSVFP
ncbi:hypothetical protein GCM10020001_006740 [Nonomuraea salmonea]